MKLAAFSLVNSTVFCLAREGEVLTKIQIQQNILCMICKHNHDGTQALKVIFPVIHSILAECRGGGMSKNMRGSTSNNL